MIYELTLVYSHLLKTNNRNYILKERFTKLAKNWMTDILLGYKKEKKMFDRH